MQLDEVMTSRSSDGLAVSFHDVVVEAHINTAFVSKVAKFSGNEAEHLSRRIERLYDLASFLSSFVSKPPADRFFSKVARDRFKAAGLIVLSSLSECALKASTSKPRHRF